MRKSILSNSVQVSNHDIIELLIFIMRVRIVYTYVYILASYSAYVYILASYSAKYIQLTLLGKHLDYDIYWDYCWF